jgi:hypothetical protein
MSQLRENAGAERGQRLQARAYEVLLKFEDGHEELRLGDHLDLLSRGDDVLMLRGEPWRILTKEDAVPPDLVGRLICERLRTPARRRRPARPRAEGRRFRLNGPF